MQNYLTKIKRKLNSLAPADPRYGINISQYDFLDLGSKDGGSIDYCKSRFGGHRGLGVDFRGKYVDKANLLGRDTINEDVLKLELNHKFKFVSMMDFLEHLPSKDASFQVLKKATSWGKDFLFIRHPSFEDTDYLKMHDLKMTWYDWAGHTNMLTLQDYLTMFDQLGLNSYFVRYISPIHSSKNKYIIPITAPIDTLEYSLKQHGKKPAIKFDRPLYAKLDIFIALRPFSKKDWSKITAPLESDNDMSE